MSVQAVYESSLIFLHSHFVADVRTDIATFELVSIAEIMQVLIKYIITSMSAFFFSE